MHLYYRAIGGTVGRIQFESKLFSPNETTIMETSIYKLISLYSIAFLEVVNRRIDCNQGLQNFFFYLS